MKIQDFPKIFSIAKRVAFIDEKGNNLPELDFSLPIFKGVEIYLNTLDNEQTWKLVEKISESPISEIKFNLTLPDQALMLFWYLREYSRAMTMIKITEEAEDFDQCNQTSTLKTESGYPRSSIGDVLFHLRKHGVPETIAGSVTVGDEQIKYGGKHFARYKYFDDIEQPLFNFVDGSYRQQPIMVEEGGTQKPMFRLSLGPHDNPSLIFEGHDATPELHDFIRSECLTQWMDKPGYQISKDSGAFFQGGSHDRDGKYIYIEFWIPRGAQTFVDFVNSNYKPPKV
jgi:hypothetical protein